jgi:hypothetical protein
MKLPCGGLVCRLAIVGAAAVLPGGLGLAAEDTGWRQPGVRVWYIGATASYSGQGDAEEAQLIERAAGTGLRVVKHSAVDFWNAPLPSSVLAAPDPASEGPFWISPQRLRQLHQADAFSWQGLALVVKARITYQRAEDLPFIAHLPVQALYQVQAPRELITLTGENDGVFGDYFFDVETGLGLSSTLATPGFYMMMMLAEINYDFATHQAFAEDDGPHTGFRARQGAGRLQWPVNQFYLFEERIVSRYGFLVRADLTLSLNNIATGASFSGNYYSLFDGVTRQFSLTPITRGDAAAAAGAKAWTSNGTHAFFWVPPGDLSRAGIRVWDVDLTRRSPVGGDTVFAADVPPATGNGIWGFTRLQVDADGFVREMTVQAPWMGFDVDSSVALSASKINEVTGRAYYKATMGQASPPCPITLVPERRAHPATADSGSFSVVAGGLCGWVAESSDTWLHSSSSGYGSGTVHYEVDANPGAPRTGTFTVRDQVFTVTQSKWIPLTVLGLQMALHFPAGKEDVATLRLRFTAPAEARFVNVPATLTLGGVPLTFTLDARGTGVHGASRLSVKINHGLAAVAADLRGDWDDRWAALGLTDETVAGRRVTLPVGLDIGGSTPVALTAQKVLLYNARAGVSGQAR